MLRWPGALEPPVFPLLGSLHGPVLAQPAEQAAELVSNGAEVLDIVGPLVLDSLESTSGPIVGMEYIYIYSYDILVYIYL